MTRVYLLFTVFLLSGGMSCAQKQKAYDCVQELPKKLQLGTSRADAEYILNQCGFTHSYDQRSSTIYGLKRGEKTGITRQDWSAEVKLDKANKVSSVKVEKVFTGP